MRPRFRESNAPDLRRFKKGVDKKITGWVIRDKYNNKLDSRLSKDLAKIRTGEPVDYVIGWKPFLNCRIDLSFKPLIPRPETEFWTEQALSVLNTECLTPRGGRIRVADVFAGSGCIGTAILKNTKHSRVDFFEKDNVLVKQIKKNMVINKVLPSRYKIFNSDILARASSKYDFILANPPYISTLACKTIQKSVLKNEPHLALFGGKSGLLYIKKFLTQAQLHLAPAEETRPAGQIWMEFSPSQKPAIEKILKQKYRRWQFKKDQYGKWRFVIIFSE